MSNEFHDHGPRRTGAIADIVTSLRDLPTDVLVGLSMGIAELIAEGKPAPLRIVRAQPKLKRDAPLSA